MIWAMFERTRHVAAVCWDWLAYAVEDVRELWKALGDAERQYEHYMKRSHRD